MPVTDQPLAAVLGQIVSMTGEPRPRLPGPTRLARRCAAPIGQLKAAWSESDLTLGQMPVTDQPLAAVLGMISASLGLDCLGQQGSRAVAQHRGQRISQSSWLGERKTCGEFICYALGPQEEQA